MNWNSLLQTLFYLFGILFFIICIVAAVIIVVRASQTASTLKRVLTSSELEDLIMKIRDGVTPLISSISRR